MFKKTISALLVVCLIFTIGAGTAFAKLDERGQIKAAIKAIRAGMDSIQITYDMSCDAFLKEAAKLIPADCDVTLSVGNEADYRLVNATSKKDGSLFVNITFTCDVYTQKDMFSTVIPKLTGAAAEANADNESLAEDKAAISGALRKMNFVNSTTKERILAAVRAVVPNGSKVEWADDFQKTEATNTSAGTVRGTLKLTLNQVRGTVEVRKTIQRLVQGKDASPENVPVPGEGEVKTIFNDVKADAYYAAAVNWAVERNITQGTSETTFSPEDTCTRAQIVTFLWRAVGSPKTGAKNPFGDVSTDDYYYDAAVWASEKGMVTGTAFEGNTPCTRASTVMYLWKNAGAPYASASVAFSDVDENADYANAVAWAVENGVTSGTSKTEFSPDTICNRGQIVTFLNRAIH